MKGYVCAWNTGLNKLLYTYKSSASKRHNNKDRRMNKGRKKDGRKKTSLTIYLPLTLFVRFERVVEGLHERGCRRPNINFIF